MEFVEKVIASRLVVIFLKKYCTHCSTAITAFDICNQSYTAIEVDDRKLDGDGILDALSEMTSTPRTVPKVFIKGEFIGDETNCHRLLITGELARKLHHIKFNIPYYSNSEQRTISSKTIKYIYELLKHEDVVIFSKSYCDEGKDIKEIFDSMRHRYQFIELDQRIDGYEIQDFLKIINSEESFPRLYIYGGLIGGGSICSEMFRSGDLQRLLGLM